MREIQEFIKRAKKTNIKRWNIHDCSICGYNCGYIIKGDEVYYDSGCYCTRSETKRPSSWEELAEHYNQNAGANDAEERCKEYPRFGDTIKRMNEFWGFGNPDFLKIIKKNK